MRLLLLFVSAFSILLISEHALGQQQYVFNGDFTNTTFNRFVEDIESKTSYHFYYDPQLTDSLVMNMVVRNKTLTTILTQLFAGTDVHFAIDASENVYISQSRAIMTSLPEDFFGQGIATEKKESSEGFDFAQYERKEKQKRLSESKIFTVGSKANFLTGKKEATLAGYIKNATNGEPIIGASIFVESPKMIGVATDAFGYFSLTLPKGKHEVKIQSLGMKSTFRQVMLYSDGPLDVELDQDVIALKEIVVESSRETKVATIQMGIERLDIKMMRQIPLALGETDIMKVIQTLPGVQTVGEGTVGLNVRGGAANQNLILFNDATIYNPSHVFGFFSSFNPDVIKGVELYKSGITADYGGRLSSVLDVSSREGNLKKFSGSGGISPITARLALEGPIIKNKASFLIGGRSTYSDWILHQFGSRQLKNSDASFYDVTAIFNYQVNEKNHIYLSGYISNDNFKLGTDTTYQYSDKNVSLKWKHVFNNKLYSVLTVGGSRYDYSITSNAQTPDAFKLGFSIQQTNAKLDFSYFMNSKHTFTAGVSAIRYQTSPGTLDPHGPLSEVTPSQVQNEQGLEMAAYIGDNIEVNQKISIYAGLRYSFYQYLGARDVITYADGVSKDVSSIVDTLHYANNKPIVNYGGLEPRLSIRYSLSTSSSLKASYNRMRQYLQVLSTTTTIAPTDIWKLTDPYIKPQIGDQISLGFYKNLRHSSVEFSIEAYYKTIQNAVDFKGGAVLIMNKHVETDVVNANGRAYGLEVAFKKSFGKLNGWMSYTYSRSLLQANNAYPSETVNNGQWYSSSYDKPTAINLVANYKFSRRVNVSLNTTYSTGRPITLPLVKYELGQSTRVYYSDRNQFRIPDYFRMDFSINMEGNHKIRKLGHSSWTLGVYNLTGRANAYSVFFRSENGEIKGYKLSIFAQPIPTLTYNFKF